MLLRRLSSKLGAPKSLTDQAFRAEAVESLTPCTSGRGVGLGSSRNPPAVPNGTLWNSNLVILLRSLTVLHLLFHEIPDDPE